MYIKCRNKDIRMHIYKIKQPQLQKDKKNNVYSHELFCSTRMNKKAIFCSTTMKTFINSKHRAEVWYRKSK